MKKIIVLVVLVLAIGAGYFAVQWQVGKAVEAKFQSIPFANARFDSTLLDYTGKLTINKVSVSVPLADTSFTIQSIEIATGSFFDTWQLEKNLKDGKLPSTLSVKLNGFSTSLSSQSLALQSDNQPANVLEEIFALGCGNVKTIGVKQLNDLGLLNVTFDLGVSYTYLAESDELVSVLELTVDGLSRMMFKQTSVGFSSVFEDYNTALYTFDPTAISTSNMHMELIDLGFNRAARDYCADQANLSAGEWSTLHGQMVASAMSQIELTTDMDYLDMYQQFRQPRSSVVIDLSPLPGFNMGELQYYEVADLIELTKLELMLNGSPVEIKPVSWNAEKLAALNLDAVRTEFQVGQPEPSTEEAPQEMVGRDRILKEVPVSELARHLNRTVQFERNDGQKFSGELISVTSERAVIRMRLLNGFSELPFKLSEITVAKLYPES